MSAVLLLLLFHVDRPRRVFAGLVAGTFGLALLSLVAVGPTMLVNWLQGLAGWNLLLCRDVDVRRRQRKLTLERE